MTATDLAPATRGYPLLDTTAHPGPHLVVHTLTTLTGVCLNRDMAGLPKSLNLGGAERMRVSPQARSGRSASGYGNRPPTPSRAPAAACYP